MISFRSNPLRLAGGLLVAAALFGCESLGPVAVPEAPDARDGALADPPLQIPVDLDDVYSGDPRQDPFTISLADDWVYVEILDVEEHLPTPNVTADDVRIGDDFESGVPAESFEVLDINNDGNRDIRLRWVLEDLEAAGHLPVGVATIEVWGQDPNTGEEYHGQAEVEVVDPEPPVTEELVVVNDGNPFFDIALDFPDAQNAQLVRNLVNFENEGPRSDGTVVWWDRGRNSATTTTPVRAQEVIAAEGYTVEVILSDVGDRFLDIPIDVRSIWLWTPRVAFTDPEINALKEFVAEGGRILFIGENGSFYGPAGMATMNDFLAKMGTSMQTLGGSTGVGFTTTTNIEPHPLMAGISALRFAGAGILGTGPAANPMFFDHTGDNLLAASEAVDTTPLTGRERFETFRGPYRAVPPGLSETGQ